jgi:hypothetical protein
MAFRVHRAVKKWLNPGPFEPVLLREPLRSEVDGLLGQDEYYPAIRQVRTRTDIGLAAAKRVVDEMKADQKATKGPGSG